MKIIIIVISNNMTGENRERRLVKTERERELTKERE